MLIGIIVGLIFISFIVMMFIHQQPHHSSIITSYNNDVVLPSNSQDYDNNGALAYNRGPALGDAGVTINDGGTQYSCPNGQEVYNTKCYPKCRDGYIGSSHTCFNERWQNWLQEQAQKEQNNVVDNGVNLQPMPQEFEPAQQSLHKQIQSIRQPNLCLQGNMDNTVTYETCEAVNANQQWALTPNGRLELSDGRCMGVGVKINDRKKYVHVNNRNCKGFTLDNHKLKRTDGSNHCVNQFLVNSNTINSGDRAVYHANCKRNRHLF